MLIYWICCMSYVLRFWFTVRSKQRGPQCFKIPKKCFQTHWLDSCNIYFINLYYKMKIMQTVTCKMVPTYKHNFFTNVSILFCFHKLFLHLCIHLFIYVFCKVFCVLDHFSLFLSFSWSLLWSVWSGWMVRRNDILKVITCMVTWSCVWCDTDDKKNHVSDMT